MNQHFRGVVWPKHPKTDGTKKNYQYVVVGCLVTDTPIEGLEGPQIVLDGHSAVMAECLQMIQQKPAAYKVGDANNVLHNLSRLVEEE